MYIYITAGTYDYLKSIKKNYPQEKMLTMENENGALLLHEANGETVFKVPRKYEILDEAGQFGDRGYVVMNNIPVTDEGRPIFEYQFKNSSKQIENEPGFLAARTLRPLSTNTYIILTVWDNESAFKDWKNSSSFSKYTKSENVPQPKIFTSSSYTTIYTIAE